MTRDEYNNTFVAGQLSGSASNTTKDSDEEGGSGDNEGNGESGGSGLMVFSGSVYAVVAFAGVMLCL